MSLQPQQRPANDASRTVTISPTPAEEASSNEAGPSNPPVGVLKLRGGPTRKQSVAWSEEVVDNEGMGKKKSKICCIYHKPRAYDESSSESSSGSEDESSGERARNPPKAGRMKQTDRRGAEEEEQSSESDGGAGDGRARPRKPSRRRHAHDHKNGDGCDGGHDSQPNKYDVQPRAGGNKGAS